MNSFGRMFTLLVLVSVSFSPVSGQERLNLGLGFGFPELLNLSVRYQMNQFQTGLSIGSVPLKDESILSLSVDGYYHFAGKSGLTTRRPWYGRLGLNFLRDEWETTIEKYVYLNPRLGRDINLTKKLGIEVDMGVLIELGYEEIKKKPSSDWDLSLPSVLPCFGINMFYRI